MVLADELSRRGSPWPLVLLAVMAVLYELGRAVVLLARHEPQGAAASALAGVLIAAFVGSFYVFSSWWLGVYRLFARAIGA